MIFGLAFIEGKASFFIIEIKKLDQVWSDLLGFFKYFLLSFKLEPSLYIMLFYFSGFSSIFKQNFMLKYVHIVYLA